MKNKVTVTRANRLNLVKYKDYAVLSNVSKYLIEADGTVAVVNNEGNAIYIEARRMHSHLWGTYDMVYPMDNFEDVAKWVANGRKLEDLPSDDGQCLFSDLEFGELFLILNGCGAIGMKTDDCKFVEVGACGGATEHPSNSTAIVTRLNIGDTIEITE